MGFVFEVTKKNGKFDGWIVGETKGEAIKKFSEYKKTHKLGNIGIETHLIGTKKNVKGQGRNPGIFKINKQLTKRIKQKNQKD